MSLCIPYISQATNLNEHWNDPKVSLSQLISLFRTLYRFFVFLHWGGWVYVHVHIMVEPHLNYFSIYITWKEKKKNPHVLRSQTDNAVAALP